MLSYMIKLTMVYIRLTIVNIYIEIAKEIRFILTCVPSIAVPMSALPAHVYCPLRSPIYVY